MALVMPRTGRRAYILLCMVPGRGDPSVRCRRCDHRLVLTERSEEHTSELQSHSELVCRLLLDNKKRVYMHWHGSDVRLPSVHAEREPDSYLAGSSVDEDAIRARISIARRYCDAVFVSTAGLPDYVPDAELVPLALDVAAWRTPRGVEPAVPVVVHLPSRRLTKGSDLVDEALRPLHDEGVVVYRPLSGLSR